MLCTVVDDSHFHFLIVMTLPINDLNLVGFISMLYEDSVFKTSAVFTSIYQSITNETIEHAHTLWGNSGDVYIS